MDLHRFQGAQVRRQAGLRAIAQHALGRHAAHLGQAQGLEDADIHPAQVELIPLAGELGRGRMRMMVVVQLFAADHQAQGRQVGAGVRTGEIAVADEVPQPVDDAGRPKGDPRHLDGPYGQAQGAERQHVQGEHEQDAPGAVRGVDIAFQPVVRRAAAIAFQRGRHRRLDAVQVGPAKEHAHHAVYRG
ncbi:hypothetical protein D3C72_1600910 [compost metagenome]